MLPSLHLPDNSTARAHAAALTLAAVGFFAFGLGVRAQRRRAALILGAGARPTADLLAGRLTVLQLDALAALHPGLVFYEGMPPNIAPPGYQAVDVWVTDARGTYPDPRRFRQFHELVDEGRKDDFMDTYAFAVVDGTRLTFYVLGKPSAEPCCMEVSCFASAYPAEGTRTYRTNSGGTPEGHRARLGPMWSCRCDRAASECWTLVRPTLQAHPRAQLSKP
jgi:hypothetical protein